MPTLSHEPTAAAPPLMAFATPQQSVRHADAYLMELAAYLGLLAIAVLDTLTPPEFSVVLLYLLPIGLMATCGTRAAPWRMAIAAAFIWLGMHAAERPHLGPWLLFWFMAEKFVLFGAAAFLFMRLRQALREQHKLARALTERLRVVEQLAAGVAHEVRNPLGTLLSGVEYLARRERPEIERLLVEDMQGAIQRAEVIVRDLNDFSAPLRLSIAPIDIASAVRQAAREAQGKAEAVGVLIETDASAALTAPADLTRVVQVLVNLLRNAIDATRPGGAVRIAVHRVPCRVVIDIDDEGPGIPADRLAQVFEPFYTTKPPGAGTGLGLAVSRRIAEDHGGELILANRPQRGLRASLILPSESQA